jgi:integrase
MAAKKLTKRVVEALQPGPKEYEVRDAEVRGFLCKVTPAGRKVFLLSYRTKAGTKRKPQIGVFGSVTVEEARKVAGDMMREVAKGGDPSADRKDARGAPTMRDLWERYEREHVNVRLKPTTQRQARRMAAKKVLPALGSQRVAEVTRADVSAFHTSMAATPYEANRVLALLGKMFSLAEVWGLRAEGTSPCRRIEKFREQEKDRLLSDAEVGRIFNVLAAAEAEQREPAAALLAIRLLFDTCCRASEVLGLRWAYVREDAGRIIWPDSKGGFALNKPLGSRTKKLLDGAERIVGNPFVCFGGDRKGPLAMSTLEKVWARILEAAQVTHCGLHAIRHRVATEIANDTTIPLKVGMELTGHKTVTTYLRYHRTLREQAAEAGEAISKARWELIEAAAQRAAAGGEGGVVVPLVPKAGERRGSGQIQGRAGSSGPSGD